MRLTRLIVRDVRNLESIDWQPGDGLNVLVGPNGGGKSSLLEAIHLAAVGRSFRTRDTDLVIRRGCSALSVGAWFRHSDGHVRHVRLERDLGGTRILLDGLPLRSASELARSFPVLALSQDGVVRFKGSRAERRAVIDWGLFHVEPGFHSAWSRYHGALAQRNAALRNRQPLSPWSGVLFETGQAVAASRAAYLARLQQRVDELGRLLELDFQVAMALQRGWREGPALDEYWWECEDRDRRLGYTGGGPHRADLVVRTDDRLGLESLSSGQIKLLYLVLRLAQLDDLLICKPQADPIIFFDDLSAELDSCHLEAVLGLLENHQLQRFVTSPSGVNEVTTIGGAVFHVERGSVTSAPPRDSHD